MDKGAVCVGAPVRVVESEPTDVLEGHLSGFREFLNLSEW